MSQTAQRQTNQMPAWLMSSGAVIGIVGAIVKKHARISANSSGCCAVSRHLGPLAGRHSVAGRNSVGVGNGRPIGR